MQATDLAGRVEYRVLEAEYQTIREKVLLYPERTVARTIPAVTRTHYRRVKVSGRAMPGNIESSTASGCCAR